MTTALFRYEKDKVIQALRYHFISRPEIKLMLVLINVFAIAAAALYFFEKITAAAFLISSVVWFFLMVLFWFILPRMVYRKAQTFQDEFRAHFNQEEFSIENHLGGRSWPWASMTTYMESPHFYHLYFNARSFFIIPKDAFQNDDVHEARKILNQKLKRSKL